MVKQKRQSLLVNLFSLAAGELLAKFISFLMLIYLARVMGPEGFGVIGLALAIVSYFIIFSNAGLDPIGAREIARDNTNARKIAGSIVSLRFLLSLIAYLLLLFIILFLQEEILKKFLVIEGLILIASSFSLLFFFQGIEEMRFNAITRVISTSITAFGVITFVRNYDDILLVPVFSVIGMVSGVLFNQVVLIIKRLRIQIRFTPGIWGKYLTLSLTIGISITLLTIYRSLDVIMIGIFRATNEVGLYHAAFRVALGVIMISGLIATSYFPRIARLKNFREERNRLLNHMLRIFLVTGIPIGLAGFFLARTILTFFFGSEFVDAEIALKLLFLHVIIVFFNGSVAHPLLALDKQNQYFISVVAGVSANILLNIILIPPYGIVGAASATIVAEVIIFLFAVRALRRATGVRVLPIFIKPVLLGLAMTILILASGNLGIFAIGLLISLGVYLGGVIYLKILTKKDFDILTQVESKNES